MITLAEWALREVTAAWLGRDFCCHKRDLIIEIWDRSVARIFVI